MEGDIEKHIEATEAFDGVQLSEFLSYALREYSLTYLRKLIARGSVRIGRKLCAATYEVRAGDVFSISMNEDNPIALRAEKMDLAVIYEDRKVVVINKPAGLAVIPERGSRDPKFLNGVAHYLAEESPFGAEKGIDAAVMRPMIVHRLDRDTSGVVALAKDSETLGFLSEQFASRAVSKEYMALVHGGIRPLQGQVEGAIAVDRSSGRAFIDAKRGKPSLTRYEIQECFRSVSLVRVMPETGRMHQIRVHLQSVGMPVLCDRIYGYEAPLLLSSFKRGYRPKRDGEEKPLISRLALHACRLSFVTPDGNREVTAEAELPKDFHVSLKMLRKYCSG